MNASQLVIFTFVIGVFTSCAEPGEITKLSHHLKAQSPEQSAIRISNPGISPAQFSIKLNGLFFRNEDDLKTHIEKSKSDSEAIEISAWRFVKDHTYFEEPLTDTNWIHGSAIFLNSLGFGYCDDKAAALAFLWERLGFFSRVWSLGGHVVPEVHDGNWWRMYDPEYEVYYRLPDGSTASVAELEATPALIRYGYAHKMPCNNIHGLWNRYSYKTAVTYYTADNNKINNWYSEPLEDYEFEISIPPGGTFEFPGRYEPSLLNYQNDTITVYANARLTIPKTWVGEVSIPLVVHTIRGKGTIEIDSIQYDIGSHELIHLINGRQAFIHDFAFSNLESGVEVIYLVNPLLLAMQLENVLELNGNGVADLQVDLVGLSDAEIIRQPDRYTFPQGVYDIKRYVNILPKYSGIQIAEEANIHSKLMLLLTAFSDLNRETVTKRYDMITQNTSIFFKALSPKVNVTALLESLNDDVNFALFISLMEHFPPVELAHIVNGSTHLKNHGEIHESGS